MIMQRYRPPEQDLELCTFVPPIQSASTGDFRLIRRMNGSSQSMLVRDGNGRMWILKLRSDLQGPNVLANELLGTSLCQALGLPVPACKIVAVKPRFLQDRKTWVAKPLGSLRVEAGLHYASRFLPDTNGSDVIDTLPSKLISLVSNRRDCLGIFLFDLWCNHSDARQALFAMDAGGLKANFIDHGAIFGGSNWSESESCFSNRSLGLIASEEYRSDENVAGWIKHMQAVLPAALQESLLTLPRDWYVGELGALQGLFLERLERLQTLAEAAILAVRESLKVAPRFYEPSFNEPIRVLTAGGQERWL